MTDMINIEKRDKIDIVTFAVKRINATTIEEIKEGVSKVFDNPSAKVIIDLKGVEYIDSSGFACFLSLHKAAKSNIGVLKFANPEPRATELFHTLHLHTIFDIYDDMNACIRSFR
jgi:anti-anti-sigma factor